MHNIFGWSRFYILGLLLSFVSVFFNAPFLKSLMELSKAPRSVVLGGNDVFWTGAWEGGGVGGGAGAWEGGGTVAENERKIYVNKHTKILLLALFFLRITFSRLAFSQDVNFMYTLVHPVNSSTPCIPLYTMYTLVHPVYPCTPGIEKTHNYALKPFHLTLCN